MKLILVRHGETYWNEERRIQGGDADIELNDAGFEQARKVAAFLESEPIAAVVSSPLQRAKATAEAIASRHQLPVEIAEGLRELRVGELDGMSLADLTTTFSRFLLQRWQESQAVKLSDGETFAQLQQRAWKVVERLLERPPLTDAGPQHNGSATFVIVSHYFVTLAIILKALDLPSDCFTKFKLDPGSVSVLEIRDHGPRLVTFNDTSY